MTAGPAMRTCLECGQPYDRTPGEPPSKFARRRFCGRSCSAKFQHERLLVAIDRSAASAAARRAQVIEDLEWIVGTDDPDRTAQRLGYSNARNLERQLDRWGRHDLARRLTEAAVA